MTVLRFTGDKCYFNKPASVALEFEINGRLVTPDDGSVTFTLTTPEGTTAFDGSVALGTTSIVIPDTAHQKAGLEDTSVRFLDLQFTEDGIPRSHQISYYLISFVPMVVTADSVRALLGVDAYELPDEAITLYQTYIRLKRDLGRDPFADLDKVIDANNLLLYAEALKQCQSLHLKVLQRSKIDDHLKERAIIDIKKLLPSIEAGYVSAYRIFGNVEDVVQFQVIQTITDPVTGA